MHQKTCLMPSKVQLHALTARYRHENGENWRFWAFCVTNFSQLFILTWVKMKRAQSSHADHLHLVCFPLKNWGRNSKIWPFPRKNVTARASSQSTPRKLVSAGFGQNHQKKIFSDFSMGNTRASHESNGEVRFQKFAKLMKWTTDKNLGGWIIALAVHMPHAL